MIISIRGTSGSGKSTLVHRVIRQRVPILEDGAIVGYQCPTFRVVGVYPENSKLASGVDILNRTRRRWSELFEQIARWSISGDLLYEGLLIGKEVTRTVELARRTSTTVIFLTTPLDVCLTRINTRRLIKRQQSLFGLEPIEPVSPRNTTETFAALLRVADRLEASGVVTVERLDCEAALKLCRELLR